MKGNISRTSHLGCLSQKRMLVITPWFASNQDYLQLLTLVNVGCFPPKSTKASDLIPPHLMPDNVPGNSGYFIQGSGSPSASHLSP